MAAMGPAGLLMRSAPEPRPRLAKRPTNCIGPRRSDAGRTGAKRVQTALDAAQLPLHLANAAIAAYLTTLTALAWRAQRAHRSVPTRTEPTTRFAVLVPAHNESSLIAETVSKLRLLDYPTDLFAVHVVADNCTDATAALATEAGAITHERFGNPGKGPALEWLVGRVLSDKPNVDAFVIVDADSVLNGSFLQVMDVRLRAGDRVIQAYYGVKEPEASVAVATRYAALAARHYLRPAARDLLNGSVGLFGNGMVFAADVLRGRALTGHLTEDIELHINLVLSGERVAFAGDAQVTAEMPVGLDAAQSQNERWERGR
ncbi:MAG: glycosyltransferase family 2 protein, partial [Acidimicrobiia bacterium]